MPPKTLVGIRVLDNLQSEGGTVVDEIPKWKRGSARDYHKVSRPGWFKVVVPASVRMLDALQMEHVLMTLFRDGSWEEWRLRVREKVVDSSSDRMIEVTADGVLKDLARYGDKIERVHANGDIQNHFVHQEQSPAQHAAFALEYAPSNWTLGNVGSSEPVDMIFDDDSVLSALQEIAAISGLELSARAVGTSSYAVDLLEKQGASAAAVYVEDAGNLLEGKAKEDTNKIATVIHAVGGTQAGFEASMSEAAWEVTSISGNTVRFGDDLVNEADQLNGYYVETFTGERHEITDSVPPNRLTLAATTGISLGDRVRIRRAVVGPTGTTYAKLSYVESPDAIARWGGHRIPANLERRDIPAIDNLIENPMFREWSGSVPVGWRPFGSPSIERITDPVYTRAGGSSVYMECLKGQGIETSAPIFTQFTKRRPWIAAQAKVYVPEGHFRLELEDLTNDRVFPPEGEGDASTIEQDVWIESFGVQPGAKPNDNLWLDGVEQMRVRLVASSDIARVYFDAAMLTHTPTFQPTFYAGRASNELWLLSLEALEAVAEPAQTYDISVLDRHRLAETGASWRYEELVAGADCVFRAPSIDEEFTTRILAVERNLDIEAESEIELAEKTNDLTELFGTPGRRERPQHETIEGGDIPVPEDCTNLTDPEEAPEEYVSSTGSGREQFHSYPPIVLEESDIEVGVELGWSWDGKVEYTGELSGGEVSQDGEIKKVASGRLGFDNFNRGSIGPDWTVREGSAWSIHNDSQLRGEGGVVEWSAMTPRGEQVVEAAIWMRDPSKQQLRVYAKWDYNASDENSYYASIGTGWVKLAKDVNGVFTEIDAVPMAFEAGRFYMVKIYVADGVQMVWVDEELKISATDTAHDGATGIPAVGASDPDEDGFYFDVVTFAPHNVVQMNGLPDGYTFEVGSLESDPASGGTGTVTLDMEGEAIFGGRVEVNDDSGVFQEGYNPDSGVAGGDVYQFDPAGEQTGEAEFDVESQVALSFLDAAGAEISNTENYADGARSEEYVRMSWRIEVPEGTEQIIPYAVRLGAGSGTAWVKRLQINLGDPCSFRVDDPWLPWRIPTDFKLVLDVPLDEREVPDGLYNYVDDNGCKNFTGPDDDAIVSSRRHDRSGHDNHMFLYTWWWNDENAIMTPQPAAAYFGMGTNPNRDFDSGYHGCLSVDSSPGDPIPDDQGDFEKCNGITVTALLRPTINDVGTSGGEDIFGRWYPQDEDLQLDNAVVTFKRHGFYVGLFADIDGILMFVELPDGTGPTEAGYGRLFWPVDWTFGARPSTSLYETIDKWIFFGLRTTDNGPTINVDMFVGDCETHHLRKLSPQLHVVDNFQRDTYFEHAYGIPPIVEDPVASSRWVLGSRGHWEYDREDCLQSSDGQPGVYDEHKRYNRPLSDAEMRGLFYTVAGRRHTGDSLHEKTIYETKTRKL